jgi:hypothetical protein
LVVKEQTLDNDERAEIFGCNLTRWKDNSVAEIMDSEDPIHSIYLGSTGKPKDGSRWFIWFIPLIL